MKFRKKPVVIDAVQWNPGVAHPGVFEDRAQLLTDFASVAPGSAMRDLPAYYVITIHEQRSYLAPGDWILPEPKEGRFYPCKPDIFAATYEPVEAPGGEQ
jgi:hypothetical protein